MREKRMCQFGRGTYMSDRTPPKQRSWAQGTYESIRRRIGGRGSGTNTWGNRTYHGHVSQSSRTHKQTISRMGNDRMSRGERKSGRNRSTSKRRKARKDTQGQADKELSAERRDKKRAKDGEKRRQEKHEKEQLSRTKRRNCAIENEKKNKMDGRTR